MWVNKRKTAVTVVQAPAKAADALYGQIRDVLAEARQQAHRQVNHAMVLAY